MKSGPTAFWRGVSLTRGLAAFLICMMLVFPVRAQDLSYQAWGAVMTNNDVAELLLLRNITLLDSGLIGVAVNRRFGPDFDVPFGRLRFEAEAQLVRHFGLQNHWEVNLPLGFRFTPDRRLLGVDSIAFGIGPSLASEVPLIELRRGSGAGSRGLIYFHIELERALRAYPGTRVFFRLHHRSDGYGLVANATGSNALAIGFRRSF